MRILLLAFTFLTTAAAAQSPAIQAPELSPDLEPLKIFVGKWEINAKWTSGSKLWARNTYRVGLGGKFIEASTFAKDGEGEVYERYRTVFFWDKVKKTFVTHGYSFDGTVSIVNLKSEKTDDGRTIVESQWNPAGGSMTVKQRLEAIDNDSYSWKVWGREGGDGEWNPMMDGVWKRVK